MNATGLLGINLDQVPVLISAVGALGLAAMGLVDALGKSLLVFDWPWLRRRGWPQGLPYAGFGPIRRLLERVGPALHVSYGSIWREMIAAQYRAGRGASRAPDIIRQGVRLGLPYLTLTEAEAVLEAVWGMPAGKTTALAEALNAGTPTDPAATALVARFTTALDSSVEAAFDSAEQIYQAWARFWAGVAAVGLSLVYHWAETPAAQTNAAGGWLVALLVGLAAVPLAPVAKDLSSSLSQALGALGQAKVKVGGG